MLCKRDGGRVGDGGKCSKLGDEVDEFASERSSLMQDIMESGRTRYDLSIELSGMASICSRGKILQLERFIVLTVCSLSLTCKNSFSRVVLQSKCRLTSTEPKHSFRPLFLYMIMVAATKTQMMKTLRLIAEIARGRRARVPMLDPSSSRSILAGQSASLSLAISYAGTAAV